MMMFKIRKNMLMTEDDFLALLDEANLTKNDFLLLTNISEQTLYLWAKEKRYPIYVEIFLNCAIEYRRCKINSFIENQLDRKRQEFLKLKQRNDELKKEILSYKELHKFYIECFL